MESDKRKLLIVEDDTELAVQMKWALSGDYHVVLAEDFSSAMKAIRKEAPSLVTLDLGLPPDPSGVKEGFRVLEGIIRFRPYVKVVVITGRQEKEHALRAIGEGAYDFFCKPIEMAELRVVLARALHVYTLEEENRRLLSAVQPEAFQGMLGTSPIMQDVFAKIRKVAPTDAPVLLVGESGTGKELAARAIHRLSFRREGPFVPINCGAIPETLLESELFGHEKGAFTGAHIQRKGRIETANGGTLFLDEVGELPSLLQVKLLRFLQEQKIERVGGRERIPVDVRVVAATNRDLEEAIGEGRFREDLYYRLGVVVISLPPLRDRDGDVLLLANAFLQRYASDARRKILGFSRQAVRVMEAHAWPGNVRELENRIRRAVIMAEGGRLTPKDLDLEPRFGRFHGMGLREAREALERELVENALVRCRGNLTQAAEMLGVSRPTLYDLIGKLEIERRGFQTQSAESPREADPPMTESRRNRRNRRNGRD